MKKMIVVAIIVALLSGCATMMDEQASEELYSFEKIGEVPDTSQDELYVRANQWLVDTFHDSEAVIEYQDKEAGELAGKYVYSYFEGVYSYAVRSTISISIRDGRYRFRASGAQYKATSGLGQTYSGIPYRELTTLSGLERAQNEWAKLAEDFDMAMLKSDDF